MLQFEKTDTNVFDDLNTYVSDIQHVISATAASTYIIHHNKVVNEWYSGTHNNDFSSRLVDSQSRFNVASIRKTYLGFAVSLAIHEGRIKSIDDFVSTYLTGNVGSEMKEIRIRHLLTHTHGLNRDYTAMFSPGSDWSYNNTGVHILIRIIETVYEKKVAELMAEKLFKPYGLIETGWEKHNSEKLIWLDEEYIDANGDESNLFVSTQELAYWGYLFLNKGYIHGQQLFPSKLFDQATTNISPPQLYEQLPRNGFFWFVQDQPRLLSELGDKLPSGSFQSLGITGCVCLVIPQYDTVAVRMYNQKAPNPEQYNYLDDIKTFGNMVVNSIAKMKI